MKTQKNDENDKMSTKTFIFERVFSVEEDSVDGGRRNCFGEAQIDRVQPQNAQEGPKN